MPGDRPREVIPTGVEGLDRLLAGGIPRGSLLLLAGNPGAGKTTLAAKILYEAAEHGNPVMYVSFVEPRDDFMAHMASLGLDLRPLEERGLFHFVEALTIPDDKALQLQLEELLREALEKKIRMVAIDSVSAMMHLVRDPARAREILQNFFVNGLKPFGITAILIAEHPYGATMIGYGIEEFIVDAVIILRFGLESGKIKRIMELRKVRWAPIRQAEVPFYIRPGKVFEVSLPEELAEVPPLDMSEHHDPQRILLTLAQKGIVRAETRKAPVPPSHMVIPRGSQAVVGVSVSVNTRLLLGVAIAGLLTAYPNTRVSVVTFKASPQTVLSVSGCTASALECCGGKGLGDRVRVLSLNPTAYTLNELYDIIRLFLDQTTPTTLMVEGLELLETFFEKRDMTTMMYNLMLRNKKHRITGIYLYSVTSRPRFFENPLTMISDIGVFIESTPQPSQRLTRGAQQLSIEVFGHLTHVSLNIQLNVSKLLQLHCIG